MPLRMLRHMVADESTKHVSFGEMLQHACKEYDVDYPPDDIAETMLILAFRWSTMGLPVPQDEGC